MRLHLQRVINSKTVFRELRWHVNYNKEVHFKLQGQGSRLGSVFSRLRSVLVQTEVILNMLPLLCLGLNN